MTSIESTVIALVVARPVLTIIVNVVISTVDISPNWGICSEVIFRVKDSKMFPAL